MKRRIMIIAAFVLGAFVLCSCAPKIMTQTRFTASDKTVKLLSRKDGETFSRYLQVCTVNSSGQESNCQETMILDKINNNIAFK